MINFANFMKKENLLAAHQLNYAYITIITLVLCNEKE
jgi:hypothetical protein